MVYIAFVQMLLNQGLTAALIQKKNLDAEHLDTVFWTNVTISIGLATVSALFSGYWARANHLPELGNVISALCVCVPIEGLAIVQFARLQRNMDFRTLSVRTNVSVTVGGVVGVALAYSHYGVWALVAQQITRDLCALVLLWTNSEWRPRARFSWTHLRDLVGFSTSNFVSQLAIFFDSQSSAILMGTMFGPTPVGLYRIAEKLVNSVTSVTTTSIQSVSLPEFSRLQDKPEELRRSILTCIRLAATVTLPAMAGLFMVSSTFMTLMGPKWALASGLVKILSVLGTLTLFTMFTGPLLQALARPHHLAALEWTRTLIGTALLVAAGVWVRNATVQSQVTAIALARFLIGVVFVTPVFVYLLIRLSQISFHDLARSIVPSLLSGACVCTSILALYPVLTLTPKPLARLLVQILTGGVFGIATLLVLDKQLRDPVLAFVQRQVPVRATH